MSLSERLQTDLKAAMRAGEATRRDALRMAMAALKNRRIETGADLSEAEELAILGKEVKKRQDAAEQFTQAGREDLATKERDEIEVLHVYLPKQLTSDEVEAIVKAAIDKLGLSSKKDMGQVMKAVMAEHKGKVDGKLVQAAASKFLS